MNIKVILGLVLLCATLIDSRRSGGSRKSARVQTTRRPSQSRNVNTVSQARPTTPSRASNVATQSSGTGNRAGQATTPRYNFQTHATVRNYPQQSHTQPSYNKPGQAHNQPTARPGYQQPGYQQPGYQQPGYQQPGYRQPGYQQPGYHQPGYNQPGYSNFGYNNHPGGYYGKKDHSVRNSVFAGLGGSALGLYLGYKLGSLTNSMHGPMGGYNGGNNNNAYPSYSVVHHYHHGDKPIPKESNVESKVIQKCENIGDFCTPNTTPICLTNGTIYCTAPLDSTISCNMNGTDYKCINSSLKIPCENSTDVNCTTTSSISIPCVTIINIFGDFSTNTLTIHKISKRAENDTIITTTEVITTTPQNITSTKMETTTPIVVNDAPASSVNSAGINNKMCVTVIADPVKAPEITEHPKNEEFINYVASNPAEQQKIDSQFSDVLGNILDFLFV